MNEPDLDPQPPASNTVVSVFEAANAAQLPDPIEKIRAEVARMHAMNKRNFGPEPPAPNTVVSAFEAANAAQFPDSIEKIRDAITMAVLAALDRPGFPESRIDPLISAHSDFSSHFNALIRDDGLQMREDLIVKLVLATFKIGSLTADDSRHPAMIARFNRARTAKANKARRKDKIQEVIEECAKEHWEKKPKDGTVRTAKAIHGAVVAKLRHFYDNEDTSKLPWPKGWKKTGGKDQGEEDIKRIAARIRRSLRAAN